MLNCPSCSAGLIYDIKSGQMLCRHCSRSFDPYIFDKEDKDAESPGTYETKVYVCPGCGAELENADDADITAVCSYCGEQRIIFDRIAKSKRPEKIIPFEVTKDDCKRAYIKRSRLAFLSPGKLRERGVVDSFRGIYMPYWTFTVKTNGSAKVRYVGSKYRKGDYICLDHFALKAKVVSEFSDLAHDASSTFDDSISEALCPFDPKKEKMFTPGYLQGFYAEAGDEPFALHEGDFDESIDEQLFQAVTSEVGAGYRIESEDKIRMPEKKYSTRKTQYPVWFMSVRKKDRISYAAVNGSSGKVVADFPISPVKFFLFALLIAAGVFSLLTFGGVTLMPKTALAISMCLSVIAWALNTTRYSRLLDRGLIPTGAYQAQYPIKYFAIPFFIVLGLFLFFSSNSKSSYMKSGEDLFYLALDVAAIIFAFLKTRSLEYKTRVQKLLVFLLAVVIAATLVTQVAQPVNTVYYAVAFFIAAIFGVQAVFTFLYHNMLSYRRPPQFNKKGGDHRA